MTSTQTLKSSTQTRLEAAEIYKRHKNELLNLVDRWNGLAQENPNREITELRDAVRHLHRSLSLAASEDDRVAKIGISELEKKAWNTLNTTSEYLYELSPEIQPGAYADNRYARLLQATSDVLFGNNHEIGKEWGGVAGKLCSAGLVTEPYRGLC